MNVDYINPFIRASMDVLSTFAGITSHPGSPRVRKMLPTHGEINGFIGLDGHGIKGYFVIGFSKSFLGEILANLFGSQGEPGREELYDLAGELTNMISGNAKAELSQKGYFFDVAVPMISHAPPAIPGALKNNPVIIVPFFTRSGKFLIEASIQRIEEDFQTDTHPIIPPPQGMISVDEFAEQTGLHPVKIRRFLKTGFLTGDKISPSQWHIPESELSKIQSSRATDTPSPKPGAQDKYYGKMVGIEEFAALTGLSPAKIKSFLRSGFLKGEQDHTQAWKIKQDQVSKFKKH